MDELEEIKKKKMEKMMSEINKPHEPTVEQPGKPIIITDATVDAASNQYPLLILDCWAEWCGPCRMIGPALEEIAGELGGKVKIVKMNVDENQQIPAQFGIRSIPTLMLFKDGKLASQKVGAAPKSDLSRWISGAI